MATDGFGHANEHAVMKTKTMKDTWTEAWKRSERKHREVQEQILAIPRSQRVLRRLTDEGANREKILSLLACAVQTIDFWRKPVRGKKKELESIANQLETVAKHAQRISLDPFCYETQWLAILGIAEWDVVKPSKERAPIWIF